MTPITKCFQDTKMKLDFSVLDYDSINTKGKNSNLYFQREIFCCVKISTCIYVGGGVDRSHLF